MYSVTQGVWIFSQKVGGVQTTQGILPEISGDKVRFNMIYRWDVWQKNTSSFVVCLVNQS